MLNFCVVLLSIFAHGYSLSFLLILGALVKNEFHFFIEHKNYITQQQKNCVIWCFKSVSFMGFIKFYLLQQGFSKHFDTVTPHCFPISNGPQNLQFCTLLQVPIRLCGNSVTIQIYILSTPIARYKMFLYNHEQIPEMFYWLQLHFLEVPVSSFTDFLACQNCEWIQLHFR